MPKSLPKLLLGLALATPVASASANVIADWDAKALSIIGPATPVPLNQREVALVHLAMFDAVNSIERRYRPYLIALPVASTTSREAAAAGAAAAVLITLHPGAAGDINAALATYLAAVPDGEAKAAGLKLGATVAAKIIEARADDGATAPDAYRPKTRPGVYIPTPITVGWAWTNMGPFALEKPSQFRPGPPPALDSQQWVADLAEIKAYGSKTSTARSPQQTETARFWLAVGPAAYHQIPRQLIVARKMSVLDSARFMALYAIAITDALAAVYDAKYHYELWRPITAIRNGDDASAAAWQPIDVTPMHPEYPCAHCIITSPAGAASTEENPADLFALHNVEIVFHQAASNKDLDLMMSLFADDATLSVGGKTYTGKDQVRSYFATVAGSFQPKNKWVAYTPAQRIRININGEQAHLYFECLYVDVVGKQIAAHTFSDDNLVRVGGKWLIKEMKAGPAPEL